LVGKSVTQTLSLAGSHRKKFIGLRFGDLGSRGSVLLGTVHLSGTVYIPFQVPHAVFS